MVTCEENIDNRRTQEMVSRKWLAVLAILLVGCSFEIRSQTSGEGPRKILRVGPKPPDQTVTVRAEDPSINIKALIELVNRARSTEGTAVRVILPNDISLIVPPQPVPDDVIDVKPNPLLLVVSVDAKRNLDLNNEKHGDLFDTASLVVRLVEIFKRREENGVFRDGSNDVEKSVYIRLDESLTVSELEKVASAVRDSGSDLIGLKVDDDSAVTIDRREIVPYVPPKQERKP